MLVCHCSLAGTQACKNCSLYKEYFGEQKNTSCSEFDREWLKEEVKKAIAELIEMANTIEHRPKGQWIDSGSGWKCSNCGFQNEWTISLKHCPECCADMRGEEEWN